MMPRKPHDDTPEAWLVEELTRKFRPVALTAKADGQTVREFLVKATQAAGQLAMLAGTRCKCGRCEGLVLRSMITVLTAVASEVWDIELEGALVELPAMPEEVS